MVVACPVLWHVLCCGVSCAVVACAVVACVLCCRVLCCGMSCAVVVWLAAVLSWFGWLLCCRGLAGCCAAALDGGAASEAAAPTYTHGLRPASDGSSLCTCCALFTHSPRRRRPAIQGKADTQAGSRAGRRASKPGKRDTHHPSPTTDPMPTIILHRSSS